MKISTSPLPSPFPEPHAQLTITNTHYYPNLFHLHIDSEMCFSQCRKNLYKRKRLELISEEVGIKYAEISRRKERGLLLLEVLECYTENVL